MTRKSRRRFLTGVATIGTVSVPGIATGTDRSAESPATQSVESTLEHFEEVIERYTERLARSYVSSKGVPRLTYITDERSVGRIRSQIRQLAKAYSRVVANGATMSELHCLAQYGEIGQTFRHRAEFQIRYEWARDYSYGTITFQQYLEYIYDTLELF